MAFTIQLTIAVPSSEMVLISLEMMSMAAGLGVSCLGGKLVVLVGAAPSPGTKPCVDGTEVLTLASFILAMCLGCDCVPTITML